MDKQKLIIGGVIVVVLAGGAGIWHWQNRSSTTQTLVDQKTTDVSLGSQILLRTQNLLRDRFPETNPLKQIIKNPF